MRLSVVGLGKLGAPLAAVAASKGHTVHGVDVNPEFVRKINAKLAPVYEPNLQETIDRCAGRLSAGTDFDAAVAGSDITFVIVATPSDETGGFSLKYVMPAMDSLGKAIARKNAYHLVVMTSTVLPGATDEHIRPALEAASGKKCGRDFGLCYNPEFIALGSVIRDMLNPDFLLIGESDPRSGELLSDYHHSVCDNKPPIKRMNFVNAELTKLAVNTFVTTKISYANMLAAVCEKLPGADVDVVTDALGTDTRIGRKYLKGAMGYGGPCFPRDNVAFAYLARSLGTQPILAEATDRVNRLQVPRLAAIIASRLPAGGSVGILGLSYKAGTNVVEESQGVELARHLLEQGVAISMYDPAALESTRRVLEGAGHYAASVEDCAARSDVVAIVTPWETFRSLEPRMLRRTLGRPAVVDCWRQLERAKFEPTVDYLTMGTGAVAPSLQTACP